MVTLAPIKTEGLADRAFISIKEAIVNGDLEPGASLRDRNFADELGISRTPVREALQRLTSIGLVEFQARSGWQVTSFTEGDVRELFEIRRLVEPAAIDQLAKDGDSTTIRQLIHYFDGYEKPIPKDQLPGYFNIDHGFHQLIVSCTKNSRLITFYDVMGDHINRGRRFLIHGVSGRAEETLDEHRAITKVLAEGDFRSARRALLHHLAMGEILMLDLVRARAER